MKESLGLTCTRIYKAMGDNRQFDDCAYKYNLTHTYLFYVFISKNDIKNLMLNKVDFQTLPVRRSTWWLAQLCLIILDLTP